MDKPIKANWRLTIRCVVIKDVYCEDCTREEATTNPWGHATDTYEMEMPDWEITSINKEKP